MGRPGPYLRVLSPGVVSAGDELSVVHSPGHGVSVSTMFRALTTEPVLLPVLLPGLLVVEGLAVRDHQKVEQDVEGLS